MQSITQSIIRLFMFLTAGLFALGVLFLGSLAAIVGGLWLLFTGRNPARMARSYSDMARRMPGGGFQWGMPRTATQTAGAGAAARTSNHNIRQADVQDVVVKEMR